MVRRDSKVDNFTNFIFFFLLIIIRSGLLAGIRWSVCISKSRRSLCVSFSRTGAGLCIYHLFVWLNWNFLHISQWTTLPTQLCLALYSFCANLLHSLIMWLIISSLSPHSLHLLFCWVLSILALIWLVLMALSCAAIRRDSVSFLKFPFLKRETESLLIAAQDVCMCVCVCVCVCYSSMSILLFSYRFPSHFKKRIFAKTYKLLM